MFRARGRRFREEASRKPALEAVGKWGQASDLMPQRASRDAEKEGQLIQSTVQRGGGQEGAPGR